MTETPSHDLSGVAVIIPALNEEDNLTALLPKLRLLALGQVLVCDNGSTDATREVSERHEVTWVHEPQRGYGAACFAGMQHLAAHIWVVAFMDADQGDDAARLTTLVAPIVSDQCDFVVGARVADLREAGATAPAQRLANWLLPRLIEIGWRYRFTDLGPFRAIRRTALDAIEMRDRAYGWTIEMQIRAVELGLRIREVPVPHHVRRGGRSKISGSIRGTLLAAYWIIRTCGMLFLTRHRRLARAANAGSRRSPSTNDRPVSR